MIHTTIHRELKIEQLEPKVNESAPGGEDSFRSTSSINRGSFKTFLRSICRNDPIPAKQEKH
jgi:hypothetical protein